MDKLQILEWLLFASLILGIALPVAYVNILSFIKGLPVDESWKILSPNKTMEEYLISFFGYIGFSLSWVLWLLPSNLRYGLFEIRLFFNFCAVLPMLVVFGGTSVLMIVKKKSFKDVWIEMNGIQTPYQVTTHIFAYLGFPMSLLLPSLIICPPTP
jgi:hypothetical protein